MKVVESLKQLGGKPESLDELTSTLRWLNLVRIPCSQFDDFISMAPFVVVGVNPYFGLKKWHDRFLLNYDGDQFAFQYRDEPDLIVTTNVQRYKTADAVHGRNDNDRQVFGSTRLFVSPNWQEERRVVIDILNKDGQSRDTIRRRVLDFMDYVYSTGHEKHPVAYGVNSESSHPGFRDFRYNHLPDEIRKGDLLFGVDGNNARHFINKYITNSNN